MGILQRQTLGDTEYQLIDDLFPTYSAKTGTIAVSKHSNRVFIASPLPYDWIQTISPSAGAMSFIDFDNGNTQFTLAGPPDPGDWLGPTENYTSSGFTNHGGVFLSGSTLLTLSGTTKGKYLTTCQMSGVGTSTQANRWMQFDLKQYRLVVLLVVRTLDVWY
jgi:hypothetical protein